jgi:hypothetical protein
VSNSLYQGRRSSGDNRRFGSFFDFFLFQQQSQGKGGQGQGRKGGFEVEKIDKSG